MADILLDNESVPTAPASGKINIFSHSGTKQLVTRNDAGTFATLSGSLRNWSTADTVCSSTNTYIAGSNINIPTGMALQVGTTFRWTFVMTKSAAGTATPTIHVKVGTAGTIADTTRLSFAQVAAQTGVADTAFVDIIAILRNVGASGVLAGGLRMAHVLAATGFSTLDHNVMQQTSAGFDTTVAGTIVGVSMDPGATGSPVWTVQVASVECLGL